jgi:glycerol-3-phosphate dehydrogenase (NAD(P)+)
MNRIGIVGAGAWGTALSLLVRRAGPECVIWAREPEVVKSINAGHENALFLPGIALDGALRATGELGDLAGCDAVLLVAPAQHMRTLTSRLAPILGLDVPVVICAKGIEQETLALMTEIVAETLPGRPLAVLSGPTFAAEVAADLPTAVTLAMSATAPAVAGAMSATAPAVAGAMSATAPAVAGAMSATAPAMAGAMSATAPAEAVAAAIGNAKFRIYHSDDLIGAEIGGAVKNVIAIACGIIEGQQFGNNARAALITRGLAEMTRLSLAKGGRAETMMGLCGLGDLTLTCASEQSRNFSLGAALGRGESLDDVLGARRSVAEGVFSAAATTQLAAKLGIEMPIAEAVDAILTGAESIDAAITALLARPTGSEHGTERG